MGEDSNSIVESVIDIEVKEEVITPQVQMIKDVVSKLKSDGFDLEDSEYEDLGDRLIIKSYSYSLGIATIGSDYFLVSFSNVFDDEYGTYSVDRNLKLDDLLVELKYILWIRRLQEDLKSF